MSVLDAAVQTAVYSIKKWKGVNENPDGDTNLKDGEAACMRNFRITDGGALQIRPGSQNVAGLISASGYDIVEGAETALMAELNTANATFTVYPTCTLNSVGMPVLSGTTATLNFANSVSMQGRYIQRDGKIYKFSRCVAGVNGDITGATAVTGGYVKQTETEGRASSPVFKSGFAVSDGKVILSGTAVTPDDADIAYFKSLDVVMLYTHSERELQPNLTWRTYYYGNIVQYIADLTFTWYFKEISSSSDVTNTAVRGIWSGFVGGTEYICAACNNRLWSLTLSDGVWSKTEIGQVATAGRVTMFGHANKLYILDGESYYVWNGTTFSTVEGYVPCLVTASVPSGGGTTFEQVNKLTNKRSQMFSADGEATVFQLVEKNIQSVYRVEIDGAAVTSGYTVSTVAGTVTFSTAPALGMNNVQIFWTVEASYRSQVTAMRYAELYNGTTDNRVFLYGDGTNEVFYSGLDSNGNATAEYFPDLNEAAIGDANTPVTALIRHYNRLLAFKSDSVYSIYYSTVTLADESITAGFYVTPVNRAIGNEAPGQVCLVENRPRSLDGRSVYEWKSTSTGGNLTGDQRNAQRISQRIENTLKSFSLPDAMCYFDKINHEYYCVYDGTAVVHNTENDTWYIYTDFPAIVMTVFRDEIYFGTADGWLRHFSRDYRGDNGQTIDAYWESGSLSFGKDYERKYSLTLWVGIKPEQDAALTVGVETENMERITADIGENGSGDAKPIMNRIRLKASKFTYYKLILLSDAADTTATVTSADIRVKYAGEVR